MLSDFYTSTVQVSRPTTVSRKKTFSVAVADVPAHIQPIQDTLGEGAMNRMYNDFLMFTETEVLIGDKIEDQDNKKYEVMGVAKMEFRTGRRHYESTLKSA